MVRALLLMGIVFSISACTPADEQYCNSFGVGGTPEYRKCLDYYHTQEQAFAADRDVCDVQADMTYPPTLYDTGRMTQIYTPTFVGGVPYSTSQIINVPPDYYRNQQIDQLRMRIIEPCMNERGWNSGASWQAGRHPVTRKTKAAPAGGSLPWLKK